MDNDTPAVAPLIDAGKRDKYSTGSIKEPATGKGRFDLLNPFALMRIAKHYEAGAAKYPPQNYCKGMPQHRYLDSALRHLCKHMMNLQDEDHLAAAAWNLMAMLYQEEMFKLGVLPDEYNDLYRFIDKKNIGNPLATNRNK